MQTSRQFVARSTHKTIRSKHNPTLSGKIRGHSMTKGEGGTAPNHSQSLHKKELVASTTSGSFTSRKRPSTSRTDGWVKFSASLDGKQNHFPNRDSIPGPSST